MNDHLRPGKMPGAVKLLHCLEELRSIFQRMPVTDRDRSTQAFVGMTQVVGGMDFYDPAEREPYVERWYLGDQAKDFVRRALVSGELCVWIRLNEETVQLDHEEDFAGSRWCKTRTLEQGKYRAQNVQFDAHGSQRAKYEGGTLWVKEEEWPDVRLKLIADRERVFGSALPLDMAQLLSPIDAVCRSTVSTDQVHLQPKAQWSLYEATAWIGSRDQSLVDRQQQRERLGNRPEQSGAIAWKRLEKSLDDRIAAGADAITAEIARERLRLACERGSVQATGVPADRGKRRVVPAADFINAELWEGRGGSLHRIVANKGEPARWLDLRFGMDDVLRLDRGDARSDGLSQVEAAPPPLPKKKGRPPSYDWPGAIAALTEVDGRDDLFARILANDGPTQADAERFVAEWFELREQSPGEASIRRHVGALLQSRRESNAAKAQKEGS